MIHLPHEQCTGCQGCLNVCPKDAISMKADDDGYRYPVINLDRCINCGLCEKVCPVLVPVSLSAPRKVWATKAKNNEVNRTSASGGLITLAATHVLQKGGVVYGCWLECYNHITHIRIDSPEEVSKIQGSKYVHSDISFSFRDVLKDLKEGRMVLFTGTPCQIAGLKGYLRKPFDNLITIDIVCHGVPPMKMLEEEVRGNKAVAGVDPKDIQVDFRWKTISPDGMPEKLNYGIRTRVKKEGEYHVVSERNDIQSPYMRCFQTGVSLRENCFQCQYARRERTSDLTAADFWGLGKKVPSPSGMQAERGVSLVLVNSDKGERLFENIRELMEIEEHTFEEAALRNKCLSAPTAKPPFRERFLEIYRCKGLKAATDATDSVRNFELNPAIRFIKRTPGLSHLLGLAFKLRRILLRK